MSGRAAIVLVNWNSTHDTIECLESLRKVDTRNFDVVLVDNGSKETAREELARGLEGSGYRRVQDSPASALPWAEYAFSGEEAGPSIFVIWNPRNSGFAGGNNVGIRFLLERRPPDHVVLLNNDTIVAPDFLRHLVETAEADGTIGMVGPKIYYHDQPDVVWFFGYRASRWTGRWEHIATDVSDASGPREDTSVDYLNGCCFLVPAPVLRRVGLLDESFFLGCEDIDLSVRVRAAGYRIVATPAAHVWHKIGRSRSTERRRMRDYARYFYYTFGLPAKVIRKHWRGMRKVAALTSLAGSSVAWTARYAARAALPRRRTGAEGRP